MTTHPGLATATELQALHGELARDLLRHLKAGPTAALLAVTRAFLRDNGLLGLAHDEADRKRLHRMYTLLVQRLMEALEGPDRPSSAMLGEVRQFLAAQGVSKDLQAGVTRAQALRALEGLAVPFNKAPH